MKGFLKLNREFGREMLAIESNGSVYEYRCYGHMIKDGNPNFSSDKWNEEEKRIAGMLDAYTNSNRKDLEDRIERLSGIFRRAGVNYPTTRSGQIDS